MKHCLSIAFFCLPLFFSASAQENSFRSLANNMHMQYSTEYGLPKQQKASPADFFVGNFRDPGLKNVLKWTFKSKKPISAKVWGYFHITVYEYSTKKLATQVFKKIEKVKTTNDDGTFGKGWSYALLQGQDVLLLQTSCSFSETSWEKLKFTFQNELKKIPGVVIDKTILCKCGGVCL